MFVMKGCFRAIALAACLTAFVLPGLSRTDGPVDDLIFEGGLIVDGMSAMRNWFHSKKPSAK
jgi:hypothetical protein